MPIYGLRFRALGQTLYHTGPADLAVGDHVLIAADQGQALAQVVSGPYDYVAGVEPESLTPIERGMVCCCRRYLRKFAPVSIRMAKEQNLFLNPAKISGICGRLLCCLSYEQENYDRFHHNCPRLGKKYQTTQGTMKVLRANMFRNSLSVLNENNEEQELTLEEW